MNQEHVYVKRIAFMWSSFFNRCYQLTKKLLDDWNDMNLSTCNPLKNVVPRPPRFVKTSANLSGLVTRSFQKISASELVNTTRGRCLYELFWWSRAHLKALWQKAWEIYVLGIDCFWFGFKESRWFSKFWSRDPSRIIMLVFMTPPHTPPTTTTAPCTFCPQTEEKFHSDVFFKCIYITALSVICVL